MCHLDFQAVKGEIGLNGKPGPQGRKVLLDGVHEVCCCRYLILYCSGATWTHRPPGTKRTHGQFTVVIRLNMMSFCVKI